MREGTLLIGNLQGSRMNDFINSIVVFQFLELVEEDLVYAVLHLCPEHIFLLLVFSFNFAHDIIIGVDDCLFLFLFFCLMRRAFPRRMPTSMCPFVGGSPAGRCPLHYSR